LVGRARSCCCLENEDLHKSSEEQSAGRLAKLLVTNKLWCIVGAVSVVRSGPCLSQLRPGCRAEVLLSDLPGLPQGVVAMDDGIPFALHQAPPPPPPPHTQLLSWKWLLRHCMLFASGGQTPPHLHPHVCIPFQLFVIIHKVGSNAPWKGRLENRSR
jgi:hypothetical protein